MQPAFRILGPLEVELNERAVPLGRRERALLAVLLLNAGEVVSVESLIDGVWGQAPPSSAKHMVHEYVSRLRHALGDAERIETRVPGYRVVCGDGELDARVFATLVVSARALASAGDHAAALDSYEQALALWRGDALAGAEVEGDAQIDAARLDQDRLVAAEERIDSALALGRHRELIPELEQRARDEPLRERPRAQLMLALYRAGRQADALERYRQGRALLVEQAGIEPGRELRDLERAILQQDPALQLAARAPPVAAPGPTARAEAPAAPAPTARPRRRVPIALAAAAVLALAAGAAWLAGSRGGSPHVAPVQGNAVAVVDARSARLVGSIPVGADPGPIASGAGFLWVSNLGDGSISRIATDSRTVAGLVQLGMPASGLAASGNAMYAVANGPIDPYVAVERMDSAFDTAKRVARVATVIGGDAGSLVATRRGRLLVTPSSGLMTWVDPRTGHATALADPSATSVAAAQGFGSSWLVEADSNAVVRVEAIGTQTAIPVGRGPNAIAIGASRVWVANRLDDTVKSIDPATNSIDKVVSVAGAPSGIALSGTILWVASSETGTLTRIDTTTGRVIGQAVPIGGSPQSLVVADGKVWVTVQRRELPASVTAGGTVVVNRPSPNAPLNLDPALVNIPNANLILYSTCLELVNYPDRPGAAGTRLVPDAARALPSLSRDRLMLTFQIRTGMRFSPPSNQVVTAATFKNSIERSLDRRLVPKGEDPPALGYVADVIGARAFSAGKAAHVTGITARGNTLTIRLLRPVPQLPARLSMANFCALPTNAPHTPLTSGRIPSAGPYFISSSSPSQGLVLERNPNYHGTRPHALGKIVIRFGMSPEQSVTQIESGRADYGLLGVPWQEGARLQRRYGRGSREARTGRQRYFLNPAFGIDYIALNVRRPLFSSATMRRAANFALDRTALARLGISPLNRSPAIVSSAYLPLRMPGYRKVTAFPSKPDLRRARSLVGAIHHTAILYACNLPPCQQLAQVIKNNLAPIGIDVQPRYFDLGVLFTRVARPSEPYDMAIVGWLADDGDTGDFLRELISPAVDGGVAHYRSPALAESFAAADRLTGTRRLLAYADIAERLGADDAPWVAYGNNVSRDFFSARIGCVTYQPVYGIDLGALCIRKGPRP
jgi:YVTN family beta-propeller protein